MKKLLLLGLIGLSLTACGNEDIGFGNFTFDHCHVQMAGVTVDNAQHYKVESWKDDEGSGWELKIVLPDGSIESISISNDNVVCFGGEYCPVCGKKI